MIPILLQHDQSRVIGFVKPTEAGLEVILNDGEELERDRIFDVFGNCGFKLGEFFFRDDKLMVKSFEILEFSKEGH